MLTGLFRSMTAKRRRQLGLVFLVMLLGALSEIVTLGAVVPFIAVMMDPNALNNYEILRDIPVLQTLDTSDLRLYVASAFAGAALFAGLIRIVLTWSSHAFVYGMGNDIATRIYHNILHQPYAYHLKTNSSKIIGSFNNVQLLIEDVIFNAIRASVSIVIAVCVLVTLVVITPGIALSAIVGFGIVFGGTRLLTRRFLHQSSLTISQMQSKRVQTILEGIGSIRDIIIDRTQRVFVTKFRTYDKRFQGAYAMNESVSKIPRFVVESLGMAIIAFIALYLTGQPGGALAALPLLGALALGAQRLLPLAQDIYEAWAHIVGSRDITREVLDLLNLPVDERAGNRTDEGKTGFNETISFNNVSFQYGPEHEPVLKDVTLSIPKGSIVGLVGETGSGKSSLADLILGLLQPTGGAIALDGQVLDAEKLRQWHGRIAHVPQAIYLQDASIEANIAFGIEPDEVDADRVRQAAQSAKLDTFIDTLPEGYGTKVGDRGARLSGGQIQRIGIARALYKNPDVLVLDEATSALDSETEARVMDVLRDVSKTKTVIIIAHRLSTLGFCDTVLKLEDGRVSATDTIIPLREDLATAS